MQFLAVEELSAEERELVDAAIQATSNSYAKYSHFHVGAALRLDDGSIVIGVIRYVDGKIQSVGRNDASEGS